MYHRIKESLEWVIATIYQEAKEFLGINTRNFTQEIDNAIYFYEFQDLTKQAIAVNNHEAVLYAAKKANVMVRKSIAKICIESGKEELASEIFQRYITEKDINDYLINIIDGDSIIIDVGIAGKEAVKLGKDDIVLRAIKAITKKNLVEVSEFIKTSIAEDCVAIGNLKLASEIANTYLSGEEQSYIKALVLIQNGEFEKIAEEAKNIKSNDYLGSIESKLVKKHQFDDAIELTKLRNPNDRNVYIFIIKALIEESEVDMAMALLRQTSEKFTLINAVGSLINHGFYNFAKETIGRMEDEQDIELYTCANESNHLYGLDSMMCPETSSVHICYLSYKY